ncbi:MAG: serine/threonine protein kinase, partial [Deltaproteobacteria bacterium]|nr:serine/threonine protein kinase [Deltaproteobacteria bacterium]
MLEQIGRGGMGVIYSAYDEQLDRKIAVKVLLDEYQDEGVRARLLREAQALARLSHPNVITIHEVGEHEGELFLAMEFVHGHSLAEWSETKPGWREVLEVFVQAGRGLAAAHRANLVHRDFKPHNVMRASDGSVKVLDFGLAHAHDIELTSADGATGASPLSSMLTVSGAVIGTPRYMAPEQHAGEVADGRADQYSYCVALW